MRDVFDTFDKSGLQDLDYIKLKDYIEAIIVDSKLSAGTGWTPNQTAAQKMTGWNVKSVNDNALIKKGREAGILR
ncbi:hypothetical protein BPO_0533 [Bergeyella porcorum]|uniref:Uncharacterized protein n=1 Tax=Bergeyella porcorum TaxID=1735111 RepID=A0AAU0EZL8_9FLAO